MVTDFAGVPDWQGGKAEVVWPAVRCSCGRLDQMTWKSITTSHDLVHMGLWVLDHGSRTVGLGPWVSDCGSWTMGLGLWVLDHGSRTVGLGPWLSDRESWTMGLGLWVLDHGSQTVGLRPWVLDHGSRTVGLGPWLSDCGSWTMGLRLWVLDCGSQTVGLGVSDCGVLDHVQLFRRQSSCPELLVSFSFLCQECPLLSLRSFCCYKASCALSPYHRLFGLFLPERWTDMRSLTRASFFCACGMHKAETRSEESAQVSAARLVQESNSGHRSCSLVRYPTSHESLPALCWQLLHPKGWKTYPSVNKLWHIAGRLVPV